MRNTALLLRRLTLVAMIAVAVWGLVMALMPLRPFWIDEWRLIYNLKFKTPAELWGPLQFTQQFPRLYLVSLKAFTQAFDYSYTSLRLPALVFSLGTILLSWRIIPRLLPDRMDVLCPLFTLIIISSETFTYYLVQTKHYEAEIFLAVLAMWQALQLVAISGRGIERWHTYLLLCISMAIAPPFSYTYPIAITPVFLIMGMHAIRLLRLGAGRRLAVISVPLFLGVCGILFFYFTDVRQLMHDQAMPCIIIGPTARPKAAAGRKPCRVLGASLRAREPVFFLRSYSACLASQRLAIHCSARSDLADFRKAKMHGCTFTRYF